MVKKKTLIILGAVLVALCLVCVLVAGINTHQEKVKSTSGVILSFDPEAVTEISWTCGESNWSFSKNEDGTWTKNDDEKFPVDAEKLGALIESISAYEARFMIEAPESVSDYGLKSPECTITVMTDDESYSLLLGGYSSMDEERYFSVGDGNAYLAAVDVLEDFNIDETDIIKLDELPDMSDVKKFEIDGNNILCIEYVEDAGYCYSDEYVYYLFNGNNHKALGTDKAEALIEDITELSLISYESYGADADELAKYNLDNPEVTATVTYLEEVEDSDDDEKIEKTFAINLSKLDETVYGYIDGSSIIYKIASAVYDDMLEASYSTLRPSELALLDWDDVAKLSVTIDDEVYSLAPATEDELKAAEEEYEAAEKDLASAKASGTEEDINEAQKLLDSLVNPDSADAAWMLDGKLIDMADLEAAIDALSFDSYVDDEKVSKTLEAGLKITMTDGDSLGIKIYKYDGESCIVCLDGTPAGFIPRSQSVTLTEAINTLIL